MNRIVVRQTNALQHVYGETAQVVHQHKERWLAAAVVVPQLCHLRHSTPSLQRSALCFFVPLRVKDCSVQGHFNTEFFWHCLQWMWTVSLVFASTRRCFATDTRAACFWLIYSCTRVTRLLNYYPRRWRRQKGAPTTESAHNVSLVMMTLALWLSHNRRVIWAVNVSKTLKARVLN